MQNLQKINNLLGKINYYYNCFIASGKTDDIGLRLYKNYYYNLERQSIGSTALLSKELCRILNESNINQNWKVGFACCTLYTDREPIIAGEYAGQSIPSRPVKFLKAALCIYNKRAMDILTREDYYLNSQELVDDLYKSSNLIFVDYLDFSDISKLGYKESFEYIHREPTNIVAKLDKTDDEMMNIFAERNFIPFEVEEFKYPKLKIYPFKKEAVVYKNLMILSEKKQYNPYKNFNGAISTLLDCYGIKEIPFDPEANSKDSKENNKRRQEIRELPF